MSDTDSRLTDALREQTPVPPRTLTGGEVRAAARSGRRRLLPQVRSRRLELGLVAAAMVAVIGFATILVTWPARTASTPVSSGALTAPCTSGAAKPTRPTTGAHPTLIPVAALGPQAQADGGQPGSGDYILFPQQVTSWQVTEEGSTFTGDSQALAFAAWSANELRCSPSTTEVHPDGGSSLPDTVFFHDAPGGGYADGTWRVITVVGPHLLALQAQAVNNPPAGGPGDAFLVTLAAAAREAAQGQKVTAITLPRGPTAAPLPAGFLRLEDLGTGWTVGTDPSDSGTVDRPHVSGRACATVELTAASAPGRIVTYRGSQPLGDKEWLLTESLTVLTEQGAAQARAALEAAAQGCDAVRILASGTGIAGDYLVAYGSKVDGEASVDVLSGTTLISLETLPGGAMGGVPLPGGTDWLTSTARKAVARAAG
jgi:hypothetical protein